MGARPDKRTNTTGVKFLLQLGVNVFYNRTDSISAQKSFGAKYIWGKEKPLAWAGGIFLWKRIVVSTNKKVILRK